MEPLPWDFRSVKAQRRKFNWLDSPELPLQDDTSFGYDVM